MRRKLQQASHDRIVWQQFEKVVLGTVQRFMAPRIRHSTCTGSGQIVTDPQGSEQQTFAEKRERNWHPYL